jgi:iron complex transport system substrate-binding protein
MKKYLFLGIILLICLFIAPAIAENNDSAENDTSVHIVDAIGRDIDLSKPAERIGAYRYTVTEALKLIGAWDQVVGRDGFIYDSKFYPGLDELPIISTDQGFVLNYEVIMELKPDLVIVPYSKGMPDLTVQTIVDNLEPDVPVAFLEFGAMSTFDDNLLKLGILTGKSKEAEEYITFYNDILQNIKSKTNNLTDEEKPKIFMKLSGNTANEIYTVGKNDESWSEIFPIIGASSVTADINAGWAELDPEWIIDKDIDYIVMQCWEQLYPEAFGYMATDPSNKMEFADRLIEEIKSNDIFSQTDAVSSGNIYVIDNEILVWGSPRIIVGLAYLAKWLHPDLFYDLDPEAIHKQYLSDFIHVDYDFEEIGLFGYP